MGRVAVALFTVGLLAGCAPTTVHVPAPTTSTTTQVFIPLPSTAAPSATPTTTPPGGRMNALFCRFTSVDGPYYVQVFNLQVPGKGMCTAAEVEYTQEEFQAIPGLKRRCNLDRDDQIAQKKAIVSIYSDGTPESIAGARLMCGNTNNEFTE